MRSSVSGNGESCDGGHESLKRDDGCDGCFVEGTRRSNESVATTLLSRNIHS